MDFKHVSRPVEAEDLCKAHLVVVMIQKLKFCL